MIFQKAYSKKIPCILIFKTNFVTSVFSDYEGLSTSADDYPIIANGWKETVSLVLFHQMDFFHMRNKNNNKRFLYL